MRAIGPDESAFLIECQHDNTRGIRRGLASFPNIDGPAIEKSLEQKLAEPVLDLDYLRGLAWVLIALLPSSYESVKRVLSTRSPGGIYEVHFSMFVALDRDDFNPLEQDGIELLLREYLMSVRSTAAYAAWKAGLVLGDNWRSVRSQRLLIELMANARFPAGRLGAINGYGWLVAHKKTIAEADLSPLRGVARNDPSEAVRDSAKFRLKDLKEKQVAMASGA